MRSRRGYLLVFVLAVIVCCLFLLLSLSIWSQQASILSSRSRIRSSHARLIEGMKALLSLNIAADPKVEQSGTTEYQLPGSQLTSEVKWGSDSLSRPAVEQANQPDTLFAQDSPDISYNDSEQNLASSFPVPQWHHLARQHLPNGAHYVTLLSSAFPSAAFAPWGKVEVDGDVHSYINPLHYDEKVSPYNAVPIHLYGRDKVSVLGAIDQGTVESDAGPIELAPGNLAVPYLGRQPRTAAVEQMVGKVMGDGGLFEQISLDTLDKTKFISEEFLTVEGMWDLFTGKSGLSMIFSIRQACGFPLPVIATIINDEEFQVVTFHHPYPVDYEGHAKSLDDFKAAIKNFVKLYKDASEAAKKAWKAVVSAGAGVWDSAKGAFDWLSGKKKKAIKEFKKAKHEYEKAKRNAESAWKNLKNAFLDFSNILVDIGKGLEPQPPITAEEEEDYLTVGWTYVGILGHITEDLGDFFRAIFDFRSKNWNDALADLLNNTRLIHFIDRNPWGGFRGDGGFQLGMTWTVPRGRTLKWAKRSEPGDFEVVGDLWLQKGSTLFVDGNLFVISPPEKSKFSDPLEDPWGYKGGDEVRPRGTIYLEEGATLLVTGNLFAEGSEETASVQITSSYGFSPGITTAILCQGDIRLPHGTLSGITFDQLLDGIVKFNLGDSSALGTFNDGFVKPLLNDVAPHVAKVLGPFTSRQCWFAKYATTLVVIPELIEYGLQGPWPIPLPYTNCMTKIFKPLSKIYKYELNFVLGENLFTAAPWWLFGAGVVPIVPKADPEMYADAINEELNEFLGEKLTPKAILDEIIKFNEEVIPELAEMLIVDTLQAIAEHMVGEPVGGDPCAMGGGDLVGGGMVGEEEGGGGGDDDDDDEEPEGPEEEGIEGELLKLFIELIEKSAKKIERAFEELLREYRDEIIQKTFDNPAEFAEVAGVFIYADGQLSIGSPQKRAQQASGFLVANGDALIFAQNTIGSVISRAGNVRLAGNLLYYPYFTEAFLYNPQKPSSFSSSSKAPAFFNDSLEVFNNSTHLPTPKGGLPLHIGMKHAKVVAEGYVK